MPPERTSYRGSGPNAKGGVQQGGSKKWTRTGPKPARHIPWPEIFKHHISLVEGHLRMTDMIRKHTQEGTGNWRTICNIIDRTKEMLDAAKSQSQTFVPPFDTRDQVPVGSSSASMYPGYSPADHEYGKAAEEYGQQVAAARAKGIDVNPVGFDYKTGQAKGIKRSTLAGVRAAVAAREGCASSGSGSDALGASGSPRKPEAAESKQPEAAVPEDTNPYFVIDVNPTPVDLPGMPIKLPKRSATPPEREEIKKHKKAKIKHVDDDQHEFSIDEDPVVEFEDISQEVDERVKAKEAKRKQKEKKRKKSEDESVAPKDDEGAVEETEKSKRPSKKDPSEAEEPKKKKIRKTNGATVDVSSSRHDHADDLSQETEQPKKKKHKKTADNTAVFSDGPATVPPSNVSTEVPQPAAEEVLSKKRHAGDENHEEKKLKKKKRRKSGEP